MPVLYNIFQKIEEEGKLSNSLYKPASLMLKPDNNNTRKVTDHIPHEHRCQKYKQKSSK